MNQDGILDHLDWHRLQDDLTDAFISYQWHRENPMPSPRDFEESLEPWRKQYLTDPVFRAKVESLAAGTLNIFETWLKKEMLRNIQ